MESKSFNKILIVDDDRDVLVAAQLFLKQYAERVDTEADPNHIPSLLQNDSYDVILLDMNFAQDATSGKEGFHWLSRILEIDSSAVVILITAYGGVETAVQAIKEGATDFVLKPWQNEKLLATLSSAARLRRSQLEVNQLRAEQEQLRADLDRQFPDMVGTSRAMCEVFVTIQKVGATDANVLILGENGTGKDAVARALHRQSRRASEAFIRVDLGAVSESLFESELFGHKKGAFTDAREDRAGRFEIAS
jgi:DNA-binding NtrC family response regulator